MSNNELAVRHTAPMSLADTMQIGKVFAESGLFPDIRSQAQAVVKIMAGREFGMGEFESMQSIYLIQGRTSIAANAMAAAVKANPKYDYRVLRLDDEACAIEFFERGQSLGVSQFTMLDARKAGTKNLDKYARNMLHSRAMSNGVRWYCPDVFKGAVYTPDELGATVDNEGAVIDAPVVEASPVANADGELCCTCGEPARYVRRKDGSLGYTCHHKPKQCEFWQLTQAAPEVPAEAAPEAVIVPVEPDPDLATPVIDAGKQATADRQQFHAKMDAAPPPPEKKPRTSRQNVVGRFRAVAAAKGLDLTQTDDARKVRYGAMSTWLKKAPAATMEGFTEAEIEVLTASIEDGSLTWPATEVAA
jgi:hypothetical protein